MASQAAERTTPRRMTSGEPEATEAEATEEAEDGKKRTKAPAWMFNDQGVAYAPWMVDQFDPEVRTLELMMSHTLSAHATWFAFSRSCVMWKTANVFLVSPTCTLLSYSMLAGTSLQYSNYLTLAPAGRAVVAFLPYVYQVILYLLHPRARLLIRTLGGRA